MSRGKERINTQRIARLSLFTALISLCSVITIPLPFTTIPITLGLFGVLLAALFLPLPDSLVSVGAFLLLGIVGLPVFSSFSGGAAVLLSPTGGYIIGYLPCTFIISILVSLLNNKVKGSFLLFSHMLAACGGIFICYVFGVLHFVLMTKTSISAVLLQTVLPFILPDLLKAFLALILSNKLKSLKF